MSTPTLREVWEALKAPDRGAKVHGSWTSPVLLLGALMLFQAVLLGGLVAGSAAPHPVTQQLVLQRKKKLYSANEGVLKMLRVSESIAPAGMVLFLVGIALEIVRRRIINPQWSTDRVPKLYQICSVLTFGWVIFTLLAALVCSFFRSALDQWFGIVPV